MTTKYSCAICSKAYSRKSSLNNHVVLCNFRHKNANEKNKEYEELGDMPTDRELIAVVRELTTKLTNLEARFSEMRNVLNYRRKKINIINWLTVNATTPQHEFDKWTDECLCIPSVCLDTIMEHSLYDTFEIALKNNLECIEQLPLRALCQKPGTLYVYAYIAPHDGQWIQATKANMLHICKQIQSKMITMLLQWKTTKLAESEQKHVHDKFNRAVIKLMNVNDCLAAKISRFLYERLKQDISLDYDIE